MAASSETNTRPSHLGPFVPAAPTGQASRRQGNAAPVQEVPGGQNPDGFRNVRVTTGSHPQNEPSVAVSLESSAVRLAVANDYRTGERRVGLYRSTDGGHTWTERVLPPPAGLEAMGDPMVDALPGGRFLVSAIAFNRPETDGSIVVYRTTDNAQTFSPPHVAVPGERQLFFNDKPFLSTDKAENSPFRGSAYIAYTQFSADQSEIAFIRSRDGGETWSTPLILSLPGEPVQGASIAVGPAGEVYVSWIRFSRNPLFQVRRSDDGGASFRPPGTVSNVVPPPSPLPVRGWAFRTPTFSYLGADISRSPASGTVYAVWQDFRFGSSDILLSRSSDRGASWSIPMRISGITGAQDFFPYIAVAPRSGQVNVVYYSNRLSPHPGTLLDLFLAQAPPGGSSFTLRPVSDTSFDPNADPYFGVPSTFIGDYVGAFTFDDNDELIAAWTDTRTGSQEIFAGLSPD